MLGGIDVLLIVSVCARDRGLPRWSFYQLLYVDGNKVFRVRFFNGDLLCCRLRMSSSLHLDFGELIDCCESNISRVQNE